jgi:cellulose synthase/poly-beta-1,6-N-acetylglucosamine synthase-like glycosyltransferase
MIVIFVVVLSVYIVTMAQLIYGFGKVKPYQAKADIASKTFFSIVVPFRNERENLPVLLESIRQLDYPIDLFEIILIDDFSEDDSVRFVYNWRMENGSFQFTLLENISVSGSPKKDGISRAIPIAKDWIVTTDADCVLPKNWLRTMDAYIQQNNVSMLVGAVIYQTKKASFLEQFQQLDLTSLQGATIGSFGLGLGFMCNGANFAYQKSLFESLGGFSGNKNIASGDDVFLVQKAVADQPQKVHYLKSEATIVTTQPSKNWGELFQQRLRWASKAGSYQSLFGKDLAVIVFAMNLSLVAALACCVAGLWCWCGLALLLVVKFIFDGILLFKTNRFLTGKWMWFLLPSSVVYPFFCVLVALFSFGGNYRWKGRKFKR